MTTSLQIKILLSAILATALLLPLCAAAQIDFVENKGQWDRRVNFKGEFGAGAFFLENKGFTVLLEKPEDVVKRFELLHAGGSATTPVPANTSSTSTASKTKDGTADSDLFHSFAYRVTFSGASDKAQKFPENPTGSYSNFFIGNDRSKWASQCNLYQAVTYKDVYPNIDVRYYNNGGNLKYDFIVHPGGNVNAIAMKYDGPTSLSVKNKELIIGTSLGEVKELYPYSYQAGEKTRTEIDCKYVLKDNLVNFQVKNYDPARTLVIDPSLIFSTFTGSTADNWGYTATPGPDGSMFVGGIVFGPGYPVSTGAFQTSFHGDDNHSTFDIAIFKFSANGTQRLYATYLGGSGFEQPHSLISDLQGNLVVAGRTNSKDFPVTNKVGAGGKYDIIMTKLNAAGTNILGSVVMGGAEDDGVNIRPKQETGNPISIQRNYGDDARSEVILDASNNVYLASCTQSSNFPVVNSNIQTAFGGKQDGVIIKFNSNLSGVIFSTYFGGAGNDACFVLAYNNPTGNLYVGGATASSNLPGNKAGTISPAYHDKDDSGADGFVTELRGDGSAIIHTTYIGTDKIDIVYGLKIDRNGFPYIMGTTKSSQWPVTANAVYKVAGAKQFIAKLQPDLSGYVYSTTFGKTTGDDSDPDISPIAFLVDRCENVYVSGWGGGPNNGSGYSTGNTANLPEKNPLPGIPAADGEDFYFFVLQKNAADILFASHFGQFKGNYGDHVDGGTSRFDENGVIYQGICANCVGGTTFPTTAGVWSRVNRSTVCNQAAVKISLNFAGVSAKIKASINGVQNDTTGCIPLKVDFKDTLLLAKKYIWNFGDGSPTEITTAPNNSISHIFTIEGNFRVRLIAEDSSTCNVRDTVYIVVKAGNNPVNLSFTHIKLPPCESLTMQFTNTSSPVTSPSALHALYVGN